MLGFRESRHALSAPAVIGGSAHEGLDEQIVRAFCAKDISVHDRLGRFLAGRKQQNGTGKKKQHGFFHRDTPFDLYKTFFSKTMQRAYKKNNGRTIRKTV